MLDSLGIKIREDLILDGGPFYHEFHADEFIKEPWNAYSSLLFFIPIIFWLFKLRGEYKKNYIILLILPFLFINGLGSTLYHAFRSSEVFLFLDFLPASFMSFILSSYLWSRLTNSILKAIAIVAGFYILGLSCLFFLSKIPALDQLGPNIAYLIVGASYFIPIVIILFKTNWFKINLVLLSLGSLGTALLFRLLDYPSENHLAEYLPQGTHFLWHAFSVIAVFSMGYYVYHLNKYEALDEI
jgi:hypothetical protein